MRYADQSHEQPIMKDIESIYVKHADAPNLSTTLALSAWGIPHFHDLPKLVHYVAAELKEIWQYCNGHSLAAATMPRKQMLKYFWSKRPTSFTIRFSDGTKADYAIDYQKGSESLPNILDRKPLGYAAYL